MTTRRRSSPWGVHVGIVLILLSQTGVSVATAELYAAAIGEGVPSRPAPVPRKPAPKPAPAAPATPPPVVQQQRPAPTAARGDDKGVTSRQIWIGAAVAVGLAALAGGGGGGGGGDGGAGGGSTPNH